MTPAYRLPKKQWRRECEVCEHRVSDLRYDNSLGLVGTCPTHGEVPAWITGCRQNYIDARRHLA